ncbi:MAG TPA: copper ion binding protein, partial [Spirochaetia bacterium]|nr:copper ion binding protein [Spirochaetia bacterium]
MKLEEITVTGMTCASCSSRVEKVVGNLSGVKTASVNLATEKLHLEYDEGQISFDAVKKAVEEAGYGLERTEETKRV